MNKTKKVAKKRRRNGANIIRQNGSNGARRNGATNGVRETVRADRGMRAERNALQSVIKRYRDLYEFAPVGYVTFDHSGRIEQLNLAASELLEFKRDYAVGAPFSHLVVPDDLSLFLRHLARCRSGEPRVQTSLHLKTHRGGTISVLLSSTRTSHPLHDGSDIFQTAIIDLTERERAEVAMQRLAAVVQSSHDAIATKDLNGIVTGWNESAERIFGYSKDEMVGKSILTLIPTERHAEEKMILSKIRRGQSIDHYETVRRRKDGRFIDVALTISPIKDSTGKIIGVSKIARDITEQKRAAAALRESEARLRATVEQATAGMARCDRQGRMIFLNRRFAQMLGYAVSELEGKTINSITHRDDVEQSMRLFKRMIRHGKPYEIEKRYLHKDGRILWADVSVAPVRDEEKNKTRSAVAVIVDITARKKAEAALRRSKNLLQKLVEHRTRALRTANVELETEIKRRKGLEGQILEISDREQERLGQELHDGVCQQLTAIAFMTRACALRLRDHRVVEVDELEKIAQLINNSVTDARNIAHDLHKEDVNAAEFEDALRDLAERKIWKTPCRFHRSGELHLEDDKAASEIYRILREGVINANKHSRATEIVLEAFRRKREFVFSVTDNGIGLNGQSAKGGGLGFHIMQYRAQSIGARLELKSPRRGGTRLTVYLPLPS